MADYSVDIQAKLSGFDKLDKLEQQINKLKNSKISIDIDTNGLDDILGKSSKNSGKYVVKTSVDTSSVNESVKKAQSALNAKKIQFKIDTGQTVSDLAKIEAKMTKLNGSKFLEDSKFKDAYSTLKSFQNIKLDSNNIESYNKALKTCQNYLQAASSEMSTFVTSSQRLSLLDKAQKTLRENSAYTKEAKAQIEDYINEINSLGSSMSKLDHARISNGLKSVDMEMQSIGKTGKSFREELARGFKQIGQFTMTYGVLQRIPQVLGQMTKEVLNVDTAMTNLYKVTDETSAKYNEFLSNAGTISKSIGRDMASYITQTSEWAKLGYTMEQSAGLSKISSIYANVGEVDDKTAVSDMVTAMKAFNIETTDAIGIVDRFNILGRYCPLYSNI